MRNYCLVLLALIITQSAFARRIDSCVVKLNNSLELKQFNNDRIILIYRDKNENNSLNYGYDIFFARGKVDSVIYTQDTLSFKILYRREKDRKWEMAFNTSESYRFPGELDLKAGSTDIGILGFSSYKMTLQCDAQAEAIQYIEQRINDIREKAEGISISFKNGDFRYVNFHSSSGLVGPTIYFNKHGRVRKMYVQDYVDDKTGLNMYLRLRYRFGKFKE